MMQAENFDVVIVGGGQAGARAAKGLRSAGFAGTIAIVGAERHRPYERPVLSKALLVDPGGTIPFVLPEASYVELGIELRLGRAAVGLDRDAREVTLADGARLFYGKLLLATGSRVRPLSINGVAPDRLVYLRTLDDSGALAARLERSPHVTVIGGGFIGLEVAATAIQRGCRVTVIESADQLLPRLGCAEAGAAVLAHHRARGMEIRLGTCVLGETGGLLELSDGSTAPADLLVAGIGVTPDTDLAVQAGLAVDDGIVVDADCLTSDPHIYAAGDVTRQWQPDGPGMRFESWQNANLQADVAARAIAGVPRPLPSVPWVWSDQGDLNLQIAGRVADAEHVVLRDFSAAGDGMTLLHFGGGRLVGGVTIDRGKDMSLIRRALAQPAPIAPNILLANLALPLRQLLSATEIA